MKFYCKYLFIFLLVLSLSASGQDNPVIVGAARTSLYIPDCINKRIAVVANQTSVVDSVHIVDLLLSENIDIKCIFCPEHGFRGNVGRAEFIQNSLDTATGIPVLSLYGEHKKPTKADLKDIDLILFDLQDVGVRFYTYISTLVYVMEAAAQYDIPLIILDRPNPNGFYVDGPILKTGYESFCGMYHIPIVYGMTIGEYGLMVNGEGWLNSKHPELNNKCDLKVVPIDNYTHNTIYKLPIRPSPNLQTMNAIWLYPTVCLFEGTVISVGRGTEHPFELIGNPELRDGDTTFIPKSIPGVAPHPDYENKLCCGYSLINKGIDFRTSSSSLDLDLIVKLYHEMNVGEKFFTPFFNTLVGSDELRHQIVSGMSVQDIKASWSPDLEQFKSIRKKYLIYN